MQKFDSAKLKAISDLHKRYDCAHQSTEIRKRIIRGGSVQYVSQCLTCGRGIGNAISYSTAMERLGKEPLDFDASIEALRKESFKSEYEQIAGDFEERYELNKKEFDVWYETYLSSEEWKIKRERVLFRAKGICEGCLEASAEVVHHLTYRNVGNEFLFQLVALCHPCHDRYHETEGE